MRVFIDTNLWAYRLDRRDPDKSEQVRSWLADVVADLILDAHQLAIREQLNWFDALIAEAAIRSRCARLFSEDFGHGRRIDAVEVVNPLR
ncbi:hypothetical protein NZK33_06745 [Cyanobium sp. FGCU-6]|nr:hypothetical protein [Cyanobium sp. FGCU6]